MESKNKDYVFASSRVRGAERNLLTREKAEKMIDSKTTQDALKILLDLDYGSADSKDGVDVSQVDELLSQELCKTYQFIMGIAPDKEDFYAFLYPYDYHNLKVLLKAEFAETEAEPFLIRIGSIDSGALTVMLRERNFISMSAIMRTAVLEAIDVFSRTKDPQMIDFILDKACYAEMSLAAEKTGSGFVREYVELLIDTINLKTFARLREMKRSWDFFSRVFLEGGRVPEKLFVAAFDESYEQAAERMLPYGLVEVTALGGAGIRESGRFTTLEKLCDDKLVEFAEKAKFVSFGIEPLAAYLIAKEGEIRLARIVLAALAQGLDRDQIEERMRKTYV